VRATLILLLSGSLAAADPKPSDATPEQQKATALVKQLGDKRYAIREAAAKKLIEMGAEASPALTAGSKSDDEEVRNRSAALLPQAKATEWKRRAAAYLADTDGNLTHDLPLLAEYDKLIGKPSIGSRRLFIEMIKFDADLLATASSNPKAARLAVATQSKALLDTARMGRTNVVVGREGQKELPIGQVSSILFVQALVDKDPVIDRFDGFAPAYLLYNPSVAAAVGAKDIGPTFRALLTEWMKSRPMTDGISVWGFTNLAIRRPIPEAIPQLIRVMKYFNGVPIRSEALAGIEKAGLESAQATLKGMLDDNSSMWDKAVPPEVKPELRDCALAALMRLSGKQPEDYGLTKFKDRWTLRSDDPSERTAIQIYEFKTDELRQKGLKKWRDETAKK
jgi:hypothetical protein